MSEGQSLSRRWYEQEVRPRLGDLDHAAALLGEGSEVLGFDDAVSTDHDLGARCQVFVDDVDLDRARARLGTLPTEFEGYATGRTEVVTPAGFFTERVGVDPADGMGLADWLLTPTQVLASLTDGAVFRPTDALERRQAALAWYPDDIWRYVLAAAWLRVAQEQAFLGRAGARGDDLGSRLLAGRLARELMRIGFLVEQRWTPYSKWLGTGFSRLQLAAEIGPHLDRALQASDWRERERGITGAAAGLLARTNDLDLAAHVDPTPHRFFERDVRIVDAEGVVLALTDAVADDDVQALVARCGRRPNGVPRLPGSVDQAVDGTDVLAGAERARRARALLQLTT